MILFFFKYFYFAFSAFGFFNSPGLETFASSIILPIGISFYTFQGISYVIDVWRGEVVPERNFVTFAAYKSFFPQLIAGPIVRYRDVKQDFQSPHVSMDMFAAGAARFLLGLGKKVLIADTVGAVASAVFFATPPEQQTFAVAWLGAIAFAIQIYFDFSGYSDMAIGLAMMFGIRFRENFDHPYAACTITEFWRRWHISLSTWFRDYLYIPLGGNRSGVERTYLNLAFVFMATGIWHGAAWTFLLWGAFHGCFIVLEKILLKNSAKEIDSSFVRLFYFFPVITFSWVLFQAPDLSVFTSMAGAMLSPLSTGAFSISNPLVVALSPQNILAFACGAGALLMQDRIPAIGPLLARTGSSTRFKSFRLVFVGLAATICVVFVIPHGFSPFLYFRF